MLTGYSNEAVLRGELSVILKDGRQSPPVGDVSKIGIIFSHGAAIDRSTLLKIYVLARHLSVHQNFEHKTRKELNDVLCEAVLEYRRALESSPKPGAKAFAGEFLAKLAKRTKTIYFYFAVRDLDLESRLPLNDVVVLPRREAKKAIDNNYWSKNKFGDAKAFVRLSETGSNGKSQLARARYRCEEALGLFRLGMQEHLGRMGGIRRQWLFELNGAWVSRYGSRWSSGWWTPPEPIELDLPDKFDTWRKPIGELIDDLSSIPEPFRGSVRTAINWLDMATREGVWRIALPLVFSAMEALLVPETIGLKDAVLTVRSMALQTAVDHGFRNPTTTLNAYLLRNELIHGGVTLQFDEEEATDFTVERQRWAFEVLKDFMRWIQGSQCKKLTQAMRKLDESEATTKVCDWLNEQTDAGKKLVEEYRKAISPRA